MVRTLISLRKQQNANFMQHVSSKIGLQWALVGLCSVLFHSVGKWSLGANWLITVRGYPGFGSVKQLGVFQLPLDGMLVHHRSLPHYLLGFLNNLPVLNCTPGWREALWELSILPKNTTQCPWPGLEPGLLDLGKRALTMRPPRLHHSVGVCF